jgi:hypothetical protein
MTETARRIETAKRQAVQYRNYRRARDRALVRLAKAYPETYKELLEQEKVADVELGKKWVDIDGSTIPAMDIRTYSSITGALGSYSTDNREDEGDSK